MSICSYVHNSAVFCKCQVEVAIYVFNSRQPPSKKRLCNPAQLRRANPTPIRWIAQSFLSWRCTVIKIDGGISRFNFLVSDVSIFSVYSPLQMLFFRPMYLQDFNIHYCRCSFGDQRICNLLFFELADTFQPAYYIQLHLHFTFSIT